MEENIEETFSYCRLPLAHHKHMKSTNMLERLNQEIKRRTHVVRYLSEPELSAAGARLGCRDARDAGRLATPKFRLCIQISAMKRAVKRQATTS